MEGSENIKEIISILDIWGEGFDNQLEIIKINDIRKRCDIYLKKISTSGTVSVTDKNHCVKEIPLFSYFVLKTNCRNCFISIQEQGHIHATVWPNK